MKYFSILFLVLLLTTGCMSSPSSPSCEVVDETSYLEENAQKEGVVVTNSGLQYRIIEEGNGSTPSLGDVVFVDYEGQLINGDTFIETEQLDYFPLTENILPGLVEGIRIMDEGAVYEFVLPGELGYGDNPPPNTSINCGSVLIFTISLDSYLRDADLFMINNATNEDIEITESGLQYRVIKEGEGEQPEANQVVTIRYSGSFTNGFVFDETQGNETTEFSLGGLISGFSEGVQLMNKGAIYEFFLPPDLAYGENPPAGMPPNVVLIFEVELVSF